MNPPAMKNSRLQLLPPPDEKFGWRRCLGVSLLATPVIYPALRHGLFPALLAGSGNVSTPVELWAGLSLIGGLGVAAVVTSIWNRRARARRAGKATAGWWPAARPLVFSLGLVVTLVGLFFAVENWRGARAWAALEAELRQKGEHVDLAHLIRPPLPDDQNFAATPLFKAAHTLTLSTAPRQSALDATYRWNSSPEADAARRRLAPVTTLDALAPRNRTADAHAVGRLPNGRLDLAQYAAAIRASTNYHLSGPAATPAADILAGLAQQTPVLDEIAAATRRPGSRFDIHPEDLYGALLPALGPMKGLSRTFKLRSVARLATGDGDGAFDDLMTASRLAETMRDEPFTISQLVRLACHAEALRALAEGLAEHRWTDAQLQEYQKFQENLGFRSGLLGALRAEATVAQLTLDLLKRDRPSVLMMDRLMSNEGGTEEDGGLVLFCFAPSGWFDQNRVSLVKYFQTQIHQIEASGSAALPDQTFDVLLTQLKVTASREFLPYNFYPAMLMPAMKRIVSHVNQAEARQRMTITACALERYWLKHRAYPGALKELVPEFLAAVPVDLLNPAATPEPLTYRRTDDGWYVLYSFGENRKDDHGIFRDSPATVNDLDWVWPTPVGDDRKMF